MGSAQYIDSRHPPGRRSYLGLATFAALSVISVLFLCSYSIHVPVLMSRDTTSSSSTNSQGGAAPSDGGDKYLVGAGRADITGPVVEINMAGYADLAQTGTGLRQRLYSRTFIVGDAAKPADRVVYIVLDTQSGDTAVRRGIIEGVRALGVEYRVYTEANMAVTGTHSHAGPGAWFNYLLPQVTSLGWSPQSYDAIVQGAVLSVRRAHESLTEGYLDVGTTEVADAAINRSLWAYLQNPEEERARYPPGQETDTTMTLLRLRRASDGKSVGVLTWYPTHGTSLLQNNTHIAGDNKGVAAWMLERDMQGEDSAAEGFVAGFSQANVGDTTPNVLGAYCDDGSGDPCSLENSTCADGRSQSCRGRGPEFAKLDLGVSSCYEIGRRQYAGARAIYDSLNSASSSSSSTPVRGGGVKSFHHFHDMSFWSFDLPGGKTVQTCPAAMGYSFAAGTSDGPGAADFTQGDSGKPDANPMWAVVSGLIRTPSKEQKKCQEPKPILLDVGEMDQPYAWSPNIIDVQMFRIGQLVVIVSPSEVSTMAGRRWRDAVGREVSTFVDDDEEPVVVIGGPANTYAHYVVTPEEYDAQRYEGASTLYGRYQLPAFINLTVSAARYLSPESDSQPDKGPVPPDNRGKSLSFISPVVQDSAGIGRKFGQVLSQPKAKYGRGQVVNATFVGANPRNNLRLEETFAAVERKGDGGKWTRVRDDYDWFLVYSWKRTEWLTGQSEVVISWETEVDAESGTYRIKYYGDSKSLFGRIKPFEGTSNSFELS